MAKRKHQKRTKVSFSKIIGLLLLIVSVLLTIEVITIDIIPNKYLMLFIILMIIINLFIDIAIFKKRKNKKARGIATGFAFILIICFVVAFLYLVKTMGFLNSIGSSEYKIENYSVLVKKSSNYKKLSDIKGLSVGFYSKTTGAKKANDKLSSKIDVTFNSYEDSIQMANELLDTEKTDDEKKDNLLEVMVVEDSVLSIINEEITNFESDTRVIYTFKVKIKVKDNAKEVNVTSKAFNIYISGIDTFGEISSVSRSDVNMVATVNPTTKQILLTSIPRDYYVKLHTYKQKDKLTHAGMYGVNESIATIEDLLDIEINYYVKVNFTSVIDVVNALGGLTVYSDYDFTSEDNFTYSKGYNDMNGEEALSFARERHAFADGDRQRVKDQQAVLAALIKKICSKTILTKYSSLLNSLEGEFETNLSSKKIKSLVKMQLNDMATWTVTSISLDGYDSHDVTYSAGSQVLYVMEPNESTVAEASDLIKSVISGKKLNGSYEFTGKSSSVKKNTDINTNSNNDSIDADVSCQTGYTLSNDKSVCTKVESIEPTISCPNGAEEDGDKCIQEIDPTVQCESGKELVDGVCEDGNYIYSCPSGYILSNDKKSCTKITSSSPTCSDGYKLNGNKCSKTTTITPSYKCPNGYKLSGKTCIK